MIRIFAIGYDSKSINSIEFSVHDIISFLEILFFNLSIIDIMIFCRKKKEKKKKKTAGGVLKLIQK